MYLSHSEGHTNVIHRASNVIHRASNVYTGLQMPTQPTNAIHRASNAIHRASNVIHTLQMTYTGLQMPTQQKRVETILLVERHTVYTITMRAAVERWA